jgi:hypothetical protein
LRVAAVATDLRAVASNAAVSREAIVPASEYALALALSQDPLGLADFTSTAVGRDDVRTQLPLTELSIRSDDRESHHGTAASPRDGALKDGCRLDEVRHAAKEEVSFPFSPDERKIKFLDCARFSDLSVAAAEELFARSSRPTAQGPRDLENFSF